MTAEAAIALPIVAVFALALIWLVCVGITQIRATDAARDAAREVARGGDIGAAAARARSTASDAARVHVEQRGADATVSVTVPMRPPGWLVLPVPAVDVQASATVAVEEGSTP